MTSSLINKDTKPAVSERRSWNSFDRPITRDARSLKPRRSELAHKSAAEESPWISAAADEVIDENKQPLAGKTTRKRVSSRRGSCKTRPSIQNRRRPANSSVMRARPEWHSRGSSRAAHGGTADGRIVRVKKKGRSTDRTRRLLASRPIIIEKTLDAQTVINWILTTSLAVIGFREQRNNVEKRF